MLVIRDQLDEINPSQTNPPTHMMGWMRFRLSKKLIKNHDRPIQRTDPKHHHVCHIMHIINVPKGTGKVDQEVVEDSSGLIVIMALLSLYRVNRNRRKLILPPVSMAMSSRY